MCKLEFPYPLLINHIMSIEFVQIGFLLMESRWFCENRYKERTFKWVDWNSTLRTLSHYAQVSRFFIEIDAVLFKQISNFVCHPRFSTICYCHFLAAASTTA